MNLTQQRSNLFKRGAGGLALVALLFFAAPVLAQVASLGKGVLTLQLGRGAAPVGGIATDLVDPAANASHDILHGKAFRFSSGYHFAEQLSFEIGFGHLGTMTSSARYLASDVLNVETSLFVIDADLVANIPVAPSARVDITLGVAESALHSTVRTQNGSALPAGTNGGDNVRRLGVTAGLDLEWRISDVVSVLVGYHAYTHVGSPTLRDSASGTATAILAGFRFEF